MTGTTDETAPAHAALDRVRNLARTWVTLEASPKGDAELAARVGRWLLDVIHENWGSGAEKTLHLVTGMAEAWLRPGADLFYPAAGQCVLDVIKDTPSPDTAAVPAGELAAFGLLLERTERAVTDLYRRLDTEVGQAVAAERALILAAAENLRVTLARPGNGPGQGEQFDVVPLAALRDLLAHGAGSITGFWLTVDGEDGHIIMSAPCADTLGCLWYHRGGERVALGELAAAAAHTGEAAEKVHAALAAATQEEASADA